MKSNNFVKNIKKKNIRKMNKGLLMVFIWLEKKYDILTR